MEQQKVTTIGRRLEGGDWWGKPLQDLLDRTGTCNTHRPLLLLAALWMTLQE